MSSDRVGGGATIVTRPRFDPVGFHVDEAGDIVVVDRLKELIKVNAFQVAPAEVEAVIAGHPEIGDVAVVGVPDPRTGETPVAFIVTDRDVEPDDLRAWIEARLATYKRPSAIHIVDDLPRTPSGKLLRRQLRDAIGAV